MGSIPAGNILNIQGFNALRGDPAFGRIHGNATGKAPPFVGGEVAMLAVNGYYNGTNIILEQEVDMIKGQRLMVILETPKQTRKKIDFDKYVTTTERGRNVEEYMKEMRENDRV